MIPGGGGNYCRRILRRFVVYFNRRVNALLLCTGCRRIMVNQRKSATKPREITLRLLVIRPETADWTGIKP